ncbi:25855_t:CDS:2 [Racocetra persica]|uniref:25855_t:CDS:1 n=1 Tax=Racocetra persica TaxID=160502 RepID=A0ACA9NGV5_9GLOM|nr:25855_t:CDS:2 [Racocetra persica]
MIHSDRSACHLPAQFTIVIVTTLFFKDSEITHWNLYDFLLYRIKQQDFKIVSQLESSYYLSFLKYFKNEHHEESEFLIKQYKISIAENFNKLEKLINELSRKKQEWIAKNVNVDFDTLEISEAAKKLVLSQTITTSTPSSSLSKRAKETLREINSLFPNEQVFVIDNAILLTPKRVPISTNNDDLIPDIQI